MQQSKTSETTTKKAKNNYHAIVFQKSNKTRKIIYIFKYIYDVTIMY